MNISELCTRDFVVAERGTSIPDAAKLMRAFHRGDLIVVDDNDARRPIGILTDRDLVVGVLAENWDRIPTLVVEDVMTRDLVSVPAGTDIFEALKTMRTHGIRRVPVVGAMGEILGVVSFDDLIELVAEQMSDLAQLLAREQKHEKEVRDLAIEDAAQTRH